jgi:hypothetical protein
MPSRISARSAVRSTASRRQDRPRERRQRVGTGVRRRSARTSSFRRPIWPSACRFWVVSGSGAPGLAFPCEQPSRAPSSGSKATASAKSTKSAPGQKETVADDRFEVGWHVMASSALGLALGRLAQFLTPPDQAAPLTKRFVKDLSRRCVALAFLTGGLISMACGATSERPQGENCRLTAPPRSAGEINAPRQVVFVYPRTKDIGIGYLGCQTAWARGEHGTWEIVSLVRIERRNVVEVWPPPPDGESPGHCTYSHGRILPNSPDECRTLQTISFPPGCLTRSLRLHVYPAMPKGCEEG